MMNVRNCKKCCIFETKPQIPPMDPIICTEPLDLVHIDYMSMEVTVGVKEKLVMKNMLVVKDHFTHYTQVYVTNNHMACVLYNEFLLSVWVPTMTHVWPSHWIHGPSHIWIVWLTGHYQNLDVALPSPDERHGWVSPPDTQKNDSQNGSWQENQITFTPWTYTDHLQCHTVPDNQLLALFLNVWAPTKVTSGPVLTQGRAIFFSARGGEIEMWLLWREVFWCQRHDDPMSDTWAVPTWNNQCHTT